jgi:hypothetical protein
MREHTLSREAQHFHTPARTDAQLRPRISRPVGQLWSSHEYRATRSTRGSLSPPEAKNRDIPKTAETLSVQSSSSALRRIFNHRYSLLCREFPDTSHVGRIPVQVSYDYSVYAAPDNRAHRVKIGTQGGRIEVVESYAHSRSESGGSEIDARIGGVRDRSTLWHDLAERKD